MITLIILDICLAVGMVAYCIDKIKNKEPIVSVKINKKYKTGEDKELKELREQGKQLLEDLEKLDLEKEDE